MLKDYHNLAKKSSWLLAVLFLFVPFIAVLAKEPTDPQYGLQKSFYDQIGASYAWNYSLGSQEVVVAVIDIGVDIDHEDLKGNIWRNIDEIPDNKIDDDNNGYIDDIDGWNFVEDNNDPRVPDLNLFFSSEQSTANHGTVAAGLIGARGNNSLAGAGLNWQVRIMPIRAIGNNGSGSFGNMAKAVDYAVDNGADIINISVVGEYEDERLYDSLIRAKQKGVLTVAAAGNEGVNFKGHLDYNPAYPICYDDKTKYGVTLGVASVDKNDGLSAFSSYGSCVDLTAPGEKIKSIIYYNPAKGFKENFSATGFNGTSFATPLVSGVAALYKSLAPGATVEQMTEAIVQDSDSILYLNSAYEDLIGQGRLNAGRVAQAASADKTWLKNSFADLYYQQGNEIYRYNTIEKKEELVVRMQFINLIDLAVLDINDDNQIELIMLIKQGDFYFVRVIDQQGRLARNFNIESGPKLNIEYTAIKAVRLADKINIVVEKKQDHTRVLAGYDYFGNLIGQLPISSLVKWNVNTEGKIILAQADNNGLDLTIADWNGQKLQTWNYAKAKVVLDAQSGWLRLQDTEKYALLVKDGSAIKLLTVDIESGSWWENIIDSGSNKQYKMRVGPLGGGVLVYQSGSQAGVYYYEGAKFAGNVELLANKEFKI
ncbi:MAG: hypothetical protein COU31_02410 [Candidatus Magasanikbacteria bacterium CG10_big_fil_rev_8_21_14_0_10_40_10]|uniref:Peptidase S8/S53 domain-containing protein n=1 Tax=Candidatus Magasanikbacteria bacterium CG10_big_fil_rev_8_21_14_0_10_40_10 TaxID=1974648 RepID=A0A2M6W407_9BACT|nr:MAG: hypothetical protein COU31_02410 [Candidatus Magasanikbacteria bacterium CG10_big_fil_rev_8_21_14_0_10_40_10]